ncbi:MAG: hypothetical protein ACRD36_07760 [Candidatus Acidiferrum sp.]
MGAHISRRFCLALAGFLLLLPAGAQPQKKSKPPKPPEAKMDYYGGVFLAGDGGISDGPCFRINGRVTSGRFFDDLKSFDSTDGTVFRKGAVEVTQFPDKLLLSLAIHDQPCSDGLQPVGTRMYLTREEMSTLKLTLYWKHGVDLRPAGKVAELNASVEPIEPYAKDLAADLPKRYVWSYELGVSGAAVPLTDSLVLIFRAPTGRIAARVAARL